MYKDFQALLEARLSIGAFKKVAAVVGANDEHVLEAVFAAQEQGYATPLLVGDEAQIVPLLHKLGYAGREYNLAHTPENPAQRAVQLIREGHGDFIVKGKLETKDLLRPILNKATGLNKKGFITHFGCMKLKNYHKLLAISDCAVIPYPTFDDKRKIIREGVAALCKLGYTRPVIGALCATETVNEKMPETVEASRLQQLSQEGAFGSAVVLGPISYDLATSRESAEIKGYLSPFAGDVDMLLVPQLVTGNAMSKIWNADPENQLAGCLLGADVPIALTSRSASVSEKLNSILLSAMIS